MNITLPEVSLVVLIGPSGSGKSQFAARHFRPTEIVSSDTCRGLLCDDPNSQEVTRDAFELVHFIAGKRLGLSRLTVIDATNVQREARQSLVALAKEHHYLPIAIVLDVDPKLCQTRNQQRADRDFGPHVVRQQSQQLRKSIRSLKREGFRSITVLRTPEEIDAVTIERVRLWTNRRDDHGPFDIIGDVHGCRAELEELLRQLGYQLGDGPEGPTATPPAGRKALFLGDLVDRGPDSPGVLRLAMNMVAAGDALCVPGNHEAKLLKKLRGRDVTISHGLAETLAQLDGEPTEFIERVASFIDGLVSHQVLDDGKLVVAHAGMKEKLQGRASARVRAFALYGETTGETDAYGLPVRYDWAAEYRGRAMVVYGHTPVPAAEWLNRTICIDTGCVFGGKLTALRYPEGELVQVPAAQTYYASVKPFPGVGSPGDGSADAAADPGVAREYADLDIADVQGKRVLATRWSRTVTVREENAAAALEVMSRFAVDPRWLIYLPPTMSPCETHPDGDLLEHPNEALGHYRRQGVGEVLCQVKHMGSRAIVIVCRDPAAARRRFRIDSAAGGVIYTRTGRPFFSDPELTGALLAGVRTALDRVDAWEQLATDWVCLDVELLPWSSKARALLREQYAAVGSAAHHGLTDATAALEATAERGVHSDLLAQTRTRLEAADAFVAAYRRYCWPTHSVADYRIAPFHLLASEGHVHVDQDHRWHMQWLSELCAGGDGLLLETPFRAVDLTDPHGAAAVTTWWQELTDGGGEGMVVKPTQWLARGKRGLLQPAVKCRGREYLRIIYGPDYTAPEHLARLRQRALGGKRSLALREFVLGLEALHRFVDGEPLYRVHECVFGVLALESEPVDPRL